MSDLSGYSKKRLKQSEKKEDVIGNPGALRKIRQKRIKKLMHARRIFLDEECRKYDITYEELKEVLKKKNRYISDAQLVYMAKFRRATFENLINSLRAESDVEKKQTLPCEIYLDTNSDSEINGFYQALRKLVDVIGFEIVKENDSIRGSWFKKFFARSKKVLSSDEVQSRLEKVERAIELKNIDKVQSEVDLNIAQAVSIMIEKSEKIPNIATRLGSLLFVKITVDGKPVIMAQNLTQNQLKMLSDNPSLLRRPMDLMDKLQELESKKKDDNIKGVLK